MGNNMGVVCVFLFRLYIAVCHVVFMSFLLYPVEHFFT